MKGAVCGCVRTIASILGFLPFAVLSQDNINPLSKNHWFEARTVHFNIYSCGSTQEVAKVGARLEQFREAYAVLAGSRAVASPPIVVMAFPDHKAMQPFLPLYDGQPANLAAFFHRGSDENLIALYLAGSGAASLEPVFHEYTHLLLRHNALFWPIWMHEGMADIYSTFETTADHGVRIGKPHEAYLALLANKPLMPLSALFSVTHESPDYNERDRQGIFYAESWLLTHYLMLGDNPANRTHFSQLTTLLRQGQIPEQAFTNAFRVTLKQMETQLRRYLERGHFEPLKMNVSTDLSTPRAMTWRSATPVEVLFRLGDMLLRVRRPEAAENYFMEGLGMAPKSPLPYEGLGLLAIEHDKSEEAVHRFHEALQFGSSSFLAHYSYAQAKYRLTSKSGDTYSTVSESVAEEIQGELQKSLTLMPDFGPAHELLGFFLMVQGANLPLAEQHLQRAIQLEPDNQSYLFTLAQLQIHRHEADAARQTLEPLLLAYANPRLRQHAEDLLKEIDHVPFSGR